MPVRRPSKKRLGVAVCAVALVLIGFAFAMSPPAPASIRSDGELVLALVRSEWNFSDAEVQRLEDLYDGEVRYEDALLRALFGDLVTRGLLDHALVAVLADHGEEFGEHEVFGHGASLNETLLRVPLLVRFPDREVGRVHEPVQLAGLTASILAAAGVTRPDSVHVDPLPRIGAAAPDTVFSELTESGQRDHWLHKQSLVANEAKLVVEPDGTRLTFDLATDPFERSPTAPKDDSLEVALAAQLARLHTGVATAQQAPDPDTLKRLRALGYSTITRADAAVCHSSPWASRSPDTTSTSSGASPTT
jgi:arylsulfatase A-like enzyme